MPRTVLKSGETSASEQVCDGGCRVPVLDRVGLVIEIFAQRARSREARLQVSPLSVPLCKLAGSPFVAEFLYHGQRVLMSGPACWEYANIETLHRDTVMPRLRWPPSSTVPAGLCEQRKPRLGGGRASASEAAQKSSVPGEL